MSQFYEIVVFTTQYHYVRPTVSCFVLAFTLPLYMDADRDADP